MMLVLEKLKSPVNAVVTSVVDKHTVNFWLQKLNPMWSVHQSLGKIVAKQKLTDDLLQLKIQVNRNFDFGLAGQHHPVYISVNGTRYERSYSLTKLDATHVALNVKKVAQGKATTWLHDSAQVDDIIEFGSPYGDMTLANVQQPIILLAAGSGITPMLSLLTDLAARKASFTFPIHLKYWVKTPSDVALLAQFDAWTKQLAQFDYEVIYTQQGGERLNASHLKSLNAIEESCVYACGPSGFVSQVEDLFQHAATVKTEAFSLSELVTDDVGFVQVTLTQSNQVLTIPKGQSILSSLEQLNIKPTHGCRMGICNKCACNKVEGATRNLVNGAQNKEPGNLLKICVNSAQTDLVIDL